MKTTSARLKAIAVALSLLVGGCASGPLLSTHPLAGLDLGRGPYRLIQYGGQNARDLRSIAILDRSDDAYTIDFKNGFHDPLDKPNDPSFGDH